MKVPFGKRSGLVLAGQACAFFTFVVGVLGVAGWVFDQPQVRSFSTSGSEMKFNTALGLSTIGVGLMLLRAAKPAAQYVRWAASGMAFLIGLLTLLQYATQMNFGIDEAVFRDTNLIGTTYPGRMVWHTAIGFVFSAVGTLLLKKRSARAITIVQWLALAVAFFPAQALIGYVYKHMAVLGMTEQTGYMAVSTGLALVSGSLALLLHSPDNGLMAVLTARSEASATFRYLVPVFIALPVLLGWLVLGPGGGAQKAPQYSVATLSVLTILFFLSLAWLNTSRLDRAEIALSESEQRLRAMFDQAAVGIALAHLDARFIEVNEKFAQILGYSRKELQGMNVLDLVRPDDVPEMRDDIRHLLLGKIPNYIHEKRFVRKDGSLVWNLTTVTTIKDADGRPERFIGVIEDITDRKRAQADLMKTQEDLRLHAARLEHAVEERTAHLQEAIGELESVSYSLSHDLRAPIRAIQSFSKMVLDDANDRLERDEKELLLRVINAAVRADKLIQNVLTYSRVSREKISREVIDLNVLLKHLIIERPELQPPEAIVTVQHDLPPVRANEAYLTQCISNLLSNAVKFVARGTQPRVEIRSEAVNGEVRLWFEDNGIGIPKEAHQRIFGIFERMHSGNAYPGTGLGLAIVRRAVERMGGKVGLESEPGKGSRFWLLLPSGSDDRAPGSAHKETQVARQ